MSQERSKMTKSASASPPKTKIESSTMAAMMTAIKYRDANNVRIVQKQQQNARMGEAGRQQQQRQRRRNINTAGGFFSTLGSIGSSGKLSDVPEDSSEHSENGANDVDDIDDNESESTPLVRNAAAGARGKRSTETRGSMDYDDDDDGNNNNNNNNDNSNISISSSCRSPPRRASVKEQRVAMTAMGASGVALVLCAFALAMALVGGLWRHDETTASTATAGNDAGNASSSSSSNDDYWPPWKDPSDPRSNNREQQQRQHLRLYYDELDRYILEDYDAHAPFSDFLPSLAGYYGKPLYAFYVNRGQGIASMGVESKEYPIIEFNAANKAYQNTPFLGFRTFLQASRPVLGGGSDGLKRHYFLKEPFSPMTTRHSSASSGLYSSSSSSSSSNQQQQQQQQLPKRIMYTGSNELQLREIDHAVGIETNVTYIILPEEDFGAFVKRTTITNIDDTTTLELSLLDGLAKMQPAGGKIDSFLKNMGRTLEGWMGVYSPYNDTLNMPFYRLSTQPGDTASVTVQSAGHWCLSVLEFQDDNDIHNLPIVYDTSRIFGEDTSLLNPVELYSKTIGDLLRGPQYGFAKTASAFAAVDQVDLKAGQSLTVTTYYGKADDIMDVPVIARRVRQPGFAQYKVKRSREIIQQVFDTVQTKTSHALFDLHVQQMFLDNILRGGMPSILGDVDDDAKLRNAEEDDRIKVFHLFSRIHGDLERDYNDFVLRPTFFSEGPGDFRDIIQNRRSDVMFNPRIAAFNVKMFLSLIQADGYNPLSVEAVVFVIRDLEACRRIATRAVGEADGHRAQREDLTRILHGGPFRPGQLFNLLSEQNIELMITRQDFIDLVAAAAEYIPMAVYKAGFWSDHWTYLLDLIQSFLAVYPEWEQRIMFDAKLSYFYSPVSVQPRHRKYVLSTSYDGNGKHVRQLHATVWDQDKMDYQNRWIDKKTGWYGMEARWQHTRNATIFESSPMEKLFLLATLKFATRDPFGMGIEYEAGRPGWNDANNGLPGMLGSGMPETIELLALLRYIREAVTKHGRSITLPIELAELIEEVDAALQELGNSPEKELQVPQSVVVPHGLFDYWDRVATARETYREKTRVTYDGSTVPLAPSRVASLVDQWIIEVEKGLTRAQHFGSHGEGDDGKSGITPTYFSYNVTRWETTALESQLGHPLVVAKTLVVNRLPLFLEGPTRLMKLLDKDETRAMYELVRASPLYDKGLGMYTMSASLKGLSFDVGREIAFANGWLEHQSVWMHMEYKFFLALISHDLFDEFYGEMTSGAILPFMDPEVYGRSLMECSSFIASSAFEDPAVRGRGFLARLSGTAAEFLSIWLLMFVGPKPFFVDPTTGQLAFNLVPALPRWMFDDNDDNSSVNAPPTVSFKLFGSIDVTYHHNRGNENLYRVPPSRYIVGLRDGQTRKVEGPTLPFELAEKVRRVVFVATIDVFFDYT